MEKYKIIGIIPGKVDTHTHGVIDFSQDVPEKTLDELYESGFPYLEKVAETPVPELPAGTKKADKPKPQES